ncbi:MAG: hypothetical protein Ct9H300mP19_13310 [Dehalococcoidia bacterium]|nr:MAG: hypothetical protein Ct9H300mP19_13310 [Dehalococcoidia bacterium]
MSQYPGIKPAIAQTTSPGWPNNLDDNGNPVRSRVLQTGKFNSPHGIATDNEGKTYIRAIWLIGGRFTKLVKSR